MTQATFNKYPMLCWLISGGFSLRITSRSSVLFVDTGGNVFSNLLLKSRSCSRSHSRSNFSWTMGHFRVPSCLCFKASLSAKPFLLWFAWKWNGMRITRKVSHLDSFWNRGRRELGNGLFCLRGKGVMIFTLREAPTRETRPDHNTENYVPFSFRLSLWVLKRPLLTT